MRSVGDSEWRLETGPKLYRASVEEWGDKVPLYQINAAHERAKMTDELSLEKMNAMLS